VYANGENLKKFEIPELKEIENILKDDSSITYSYRDFFNNQFRPVIDLRKYTKTIIFIIIEWIIIIRCLIAFFCFQDYCTFFIAFGKAKYFVIVLTMVLTAFLLYFRLFIIYLELSFPLTWIIGDLSLFKKMIDLRKAKIELETYLKI